MAKLDAEAKELHFTPFEVFCFAMGMKSAYDRSIMVQTLFDAVGILGSESNLRIFAARLLFLREKLRPVGLHWCEDDLGVALALAFGQVDTYYVHLAIQALKCDGWVAMGGERIQLTGKGRAELLQAWPDGASIVDCEAAAEAFLKSKKDDVKPDDFARGVLTIDSGGKIRVPVHEQKVLVPKQEARILLRGYKDMCRELNLKVCDESANYLRYAAKNSGAPIKIGSTGVRPVADKADLVAWYNQQADKVEIHSATTQSAFGTSRAKVGDRIWDGNKAPVGQVKKRLRGTGHLQKEHV